MTAKFYVTKELLDLTLAANQWMELSENLDHQGDEFKNLIRQTLNEMKTSKG